MRVGDAGILERLEAIALAAAGEHGTDFNQVTEAMRQAVADMPADERRMLQDTVTIMTDQRGCPSHSRRLLKS